jgi:hypothetical protein
MTTPGAPPTGPDPRPDGTGTVADGGTGGPAGGPTPLDGSTRATTGAPLGEDSAEWTDQVTELIVDTVDKVRARTTGPVLNVAHASVYGIVAAIVAVPVLVAMLAGLVRFLDWIVPGDVWVAYLIIAVLMWIAGAVLWSMRERGDVPTT